MNEVGCYNRELSVVVLIVGCFFGFVLLSSFYLVCACVLLCLCALWIFSFTYISVIIRCKIFFLGFVAAIVIGLLLRCLFIWSSHLNSISETFRVIQLFR